MNINVNYNDTTDQIEVRKETMTDDKKALMREAWREYYRNYRATHPEAVERDRRRTNLRNQQRNYERRVEAWEAVLFDAVVAITDADTDHERVREVAQVLAKQYTLHKARPSKYRTEEGEKNV